MNDKDVEKMLISSWDPELPADLKDKIFHAADEKKKLTKQRKLIPVYGGLRAALVALALLAIFISGMCEKANLNNMNYLLNRTAAPDIQTAKYTNPIEKVYIMKQIIARSADNLDILEYFEENERL